MMSPVIVHWAGGPILAEITETIGGDPLLTYRFGDSLVFIMPADQREDLIDATLDADADYSAAVLVPR